MTSPTDPSSGTARPISLDELVLLNDELRALLRARVPLDVGLRGSASRISGRLGRLTERLATRIESGASLDEALAAEQGAVPAVYRAVLAAGMRSGRFEEVLGGISEYTTAMRDLRDRIGLALIYPFAVILIAYVLFACLIARFVPEVERVYSTFRIEPDGWLSFLSRAHEWLPVWAPAFPLLLCALVFGPGFYARLRRAIDHDSASRSFYLGALTLAPGIGNVLRNAELARFSHLLGLLVRFDVPLPEALRLSAGSTGDRRLVTAAESTAHQIEAGASLQTALSQSSSIPAFLRWLMIAGDRQSRLAPTLNQAATVYRQRALLRAEWIQRLFPVAVVLVVGGGATLFYALTVFMPMSMLWQRLGG